MDPFRTWREPAHTLSANRPLAFTPHGDPSALRSIASRRRSPFKVADALRRDRPLASPEAPLRRSSSPFKLAAAFKPLSSVERAAGMRISAQRPKAGVETRKDFELAQLLHQDRSRRLPSSSSSDCESTSSSQLGTALSILDAKLPNTLALMDFLQRPPFLPLPGKDDLVDGVDKETGKFRKHSLEASKANDYGTLQTRFNRVSPPVRHENLARSVAPLQTPVNVKPSPNPRPILDPRLFDHDARLKPSTTPTLSRQSMLLQVPRETTKSPATDRFNDLIARLRTLPASESVAPGNKHLPRPITPLTPVSNQQQVLQEKQAKKELEKKVQAELGQRFASAAVPLQNKAKLAGQYEQRVQARLSASCQVYSDTPRTVTAKFVTMSKGGRRIARVSIPACFQT